MQTWAVTYDPSLFTEELYQKGLQLVDPESAAKIKRFYRREDACRGLISRLLPRMLLKKKGIASREMTFAATTAGKPYITTPGIDPPIAYNVSHDNSLVVMAFTSGKLNPPAFSIGIDVMKVQMSSRQDTYASFINIFRDQLTPLERRLLLSPGVTDHEGLKRFFWMWTLKEAYTKALGIGLGFDFSRVEFDVESDIVRVDGTVPGGWRFTKFELKEGESLNVGVVAELIGDTETVVISEKETKEWLLPFTAVAFVEQAIHELTPPS
ncbi:ebony activating protein [Moniliophthora roreri MCA 2997]|uniref:holo-[acyl-carrier-protein] synthase n=1 Tax=Moniliophthora roreri (strain MCA 2997) TaxID=1381753 RepID=V2XE72_MONRO|nr:ebony activating protein [Moniliophthora roreri MCA 2997]KAI3596703.1 ebony activating protein [Moniliophthora roreri]